MAVAGACAVVGGSMAVGEAAPSHAGPAPQPSAGGVPGLDPRLVPGLVPGLDPGPPPPRGGGRKGKKGGAAAAGGADPAAQQPALCAYELEREERMRQNRERLMQLDLLNLTQGGWRHMRVGGGQGGRGVIWAVE